MPRDEIQGKYVGIEEIGNEDVGKYSKELENLPKRRLEKLADDA